MARGLPCRARNGKLLSSPRCRRDAKQGKIFCLKHFKDQGESVERYKAWSRRASSYALEAIIPMLRLRDATCAEEVGRLDHGVQFFSTNSKRGPPDDGHLERIRTLHQRVLLFDKVIPVLKAISKETRFVLWGWAETKSKLESEAEPLGGDDGELPQSEPLPEIGGTFAHAYAWIKVQSRIITNKLSSAFAKSERPSKPAAPTVMADAKPSSPFPLDVQMTSIELDGEQYAQTAEVAEQTASIFQGFL